MKLQRSMAQALGWALPLALGTSGCSGDAPKHWSALEQCLIGQSLGKDENIFAKLRGVQLAESLKASGTNDDWPKRCAQHATLLHDSLSEDGKAGMIRRALAEQLGCDGACAFPETGHPLPAADKLWEAVNRAELSRVEVAGVPKPSAPATSLTMAEWPALSSAELVDTRWSQAGDLWLLLKGDQSQSWCALKGNKAKCSPVTGAPTFHASAPVGLAPDAAQPILAGSSFSEAAGLSAAGFALATGKPLALFGESGHQVHTGVSFSEKPLETAEQPSPDAAPPAPEFDVRRLENGQERARATLKLSARVRGPEVVDGWLVYVERDPDKKQIFKAKELGEGGRVFGATTVEYVADFPGPFQVCGSKPGAAIGSYVPPVRMLGKKSAGKTKLTVALLEGKTWHPPVSTEIPQQVGQFSSWRCGGGWGGLSWIEQQGKRVELTELTCRKSGCKTKSAGWTQPDLQHVLLLGHVQDKVLLLYQSVAGDTRTRLGSLEELAKAESALAFESADFGGVEGGTPKLVEGDRSYVLLQGNGLRALLFDGSPAAVPVTP